MLLDCAFIQTQLVYPVRCLATCIVVSGRTNYMSKNMSWLSFVITLAPFFPYMHYRCGQCSKRRQKEGKKHWGQEWHELEEKTNIATHQGDESLGQNSGLKRLMDNLAPLLLMVFVAVNINVMIQISIQSQQLLSVSARNSMMIAEGVLNPVDDIFSFLDDIVLVKIGVAIAVADFAALRKVFYLGVFGGAFFGVIGAALVTIIALVEPLKEAVLDPFKTSSCPLATADVDQAATYFMLPAWQWPFEFATFAFQGFSLAVNVFFAYGLVGTIRVVTLLILLFTSFQTNPNLENLGWMRFGSTALGFFCWVANFALRPALRKRMGFGMRSQESASRAYSSFFSDPDTKQAFWDGLSAMCTELSVEMSRTICLFVAAKVMGIGAFYQVSAHMALQVALGLGFSEGAFFNVKLQGSKFLAGGLTDHFLYLLEFSGVFTVLMIIGSFAATYTQVEPLSLRFGPEACVFLSMPSCLPDYNDVFGGASNSDAPSTMMQTIGTVPFFIAIRAAYRLCRCNLYAMQEYAFMAKVSGLVFAICFVPAVVVLGATSNSAVVAVLVMVVPNLGCLIFFGRRLHWRLQDLRKGNNKCLERRNSQEKVGAADSKAIDAADVQEEQQVPQVDIECLNATSVEIAQDLEEPRTAGHVKL